MDAQYGEDLIRPGNVISGFRVEHEAGRGATAIVYLATQLALDRPVALKIFPLEDAETEDQDALFREARAAAALTHLHIVQAYSAGITEHGYGFFAMEYVDGETVGEKIKRQGALEWHEALRIGTEVAQALEYGSRKENLTHGDIKPDNIMLTSGGTAKLADFGLAQLARYDVKEDTIHLTPLYASPEMIRGQWQTGDCRADIYSLGATLYHMLTGQPPFPGRDPRAVMERHLHEDAIPPRDIKPDIPAKLSDLVMHLLRKDPDERPQHWEDVLRSLRAPMGRRVRKPVRHFHLDSSSTHHHGHGRAPESSFSASLWILLALAILATALLILFAQQQRRPAPPPPPGENRYAGPEEEPTHPSTTPPDKPRLLPPEPQETPEERVRRLELERLRTLKNEQALTPDEEGRVATLPPPTDDPPDVAPTPPQPADPLDDDPPLPDDVAAKLRAESYLELIAALARRGFDGRAPAAAVTRGSEKWLAENPGQSPERNRVLFLHSVVAPALSDIVPSLIRAKAKLRGVRGGKETIGDLSPNGISLIRSTPYGNATTVQPWSKWMTPPRLLHLLRLALPADSPPEKRRPLFALLLLTGEYDTLEHILASGKWVEEVDDWRALARDFRDSADSAKVYALWRRAQETHAAGRLAEAYRIVQQIKDVPCRAHEILSPELAVLEEECYKATPEYEAMTRLQNLSTEVENSPVRVLVSLADAACRYGFDGPEAEQADRLRNQALTHLQTIRWGRIAEPDDPQNRPINSRAIRCLRTRRKIDAMEADQDPGNAPRQLLDAAILLYLGDWDGARRFFAATDADPLEYESLHAELFLAAAARARVELRYENGTTWLLKMIEHVNDLDFREHRDRRRYWQVAELYAVMFEAGVSRAPLWKDGLESDDTPPRLLIYSGGAPAYYLRVAWALETGNHEALEEDFHGGNAYLERTGNEALGPYRPMQSWILGKSAIAPGTIAPRDEEAPDVFARLQASIMLHQVFHLGFPDPVVSAKLPATVLGSGPVAGTVYADLIRVRVANRLAERDIEGAAALLDEALAREAPDAIPLYPELLFYRAGLHLFQKNRPMAIQSLQRVTRSGAASRGENELAQLFLDGLAEGRTPRLVSQADRNKACLYWYLRACNSLDNQTPFERLRMIRKMQELTEGLGRRYLARKSATLFQRSTQSH